MNTSNDDPGNTPDIRDTRSITPEELTDDPAALVTHLKYDNADLRRQLAMAHRELDQMAPDLPKEHSETGLELTVAARIAILRSDHARWYKP